MPFGFDTKQQIANYIAQERHRQNRYAIDSQLLGQGYEPILIDAVWRNVLKVRRKRWPFSFSTTILLVSAIWAGLFVGFVCTWENSEWRFSRDFSLIGFAIFLSAIFGGIAFTRTFFFNSPGTWKCSLSTVLCASIFVAYCILIPATWLEDVGRCASPMLLRVNSLKTSEGTYFLREKFLPTTSNPLDPPIHRMEIYRCTTFGFVCTLTRQTDFDDMGYGDCVATPQYHLEIAANNQIVIVHD